mgnify:CR=1 FL=1
MSATRQARRRRGGWLVVAIAAACGGDRRGPTDGEVCAKLASACAAHGALACPTAAEWPAMARALGPAVVARFRGCVAAATGCPELAACLVELAPTAGKLVPAVRAKLGLGDDADHDGAVDLDPDRPVPPRPRPPSP